jgi:GT2 family glycosyltransferase
MKVAIIIPNYSTKELLQNCIKSIYKETKNTSFEIIVIDNGSIDGSCDLVIKEFLSVILIKNKENFGFTKACNKGITIAKGKYILLLNTDTIIIENAIDKLVNFANANKTAGIFGPKLINPNGSYQQSFLHFPRSILRNKRKNKFCDKIQLVDWIRGTCLLIRKEVFETLFCLDEYFYTYGEDIDLCYRAKKNGWDIMFYPEARVVHLWRKTGEKVWGLACIPKANYESTIKFLKKHKTLFHVISYRITRSTSCILKSLYLYSLYKITGKEKFKRNYSIYWIGFLICINKYKG